MSRRIWNIKSYDKEKIKSLAQKLELNPFLLLLLASRGITEEEQILSFFDEDDCFCDPYELVDMDKAADRINRAVQNGEKICVYGDYDADGVTATAVLVQYLEVLGADVSYYIPDRHCEGYGLNNSAIKKIAERGTQLIVTVDNGVSAVEEARYIKSLGMDLVVTDHHTPSDRLPDCVAVVDAHRRDCPSKFKHWCGVGIVFKLLSAITGDPYEIIEEYADIICAGTIGDVVSLTGENRTLVKYGLQKLENNPNSGFSFLIENTKIKMPPTSTDVAFYLVPKINAVGRVANAEDALRLLITDDYEETGAICQDILSCNAKRKQLEDVICSDIEKMIVCEPLIFNKKVIIVDGKNWHAGVIGIVAAKLVERFGRPAFVIARDENGCKGSGRSLGDFNLYECISACASILTHYGGHPLAGGFSLEEENLPKFREMVEAYTNGVTMPFAQLDIDASLSLATIEPRILDRIDALEPFGQDNPAPMFGFFGARIEYIIETRDKKHLRLMVSQNGVTKTLMKFGTTMAEFPYKQMDFVDIAAKLRRGSYGGSDTVEIDIKDIRFSGTDDMVYLRSMRGYESYVRGDRLSKAQLSFLLPDRNFIGDVYKYIRANGGWSYEYDMLCYRLGDNGKSACKVAVAIDVLCELGVLERKGEQITLPQTPVRAELEKSEILNDIKSKISKM